MEYLILVRYAGEGIRRQSKYQNACDGNGDKAALACKA
jgi:hypothetical protein